MAVYPAPQPPIRSDTFYSSKTSFYLHLPLLPRLFVTAGLVTSIAAAYQTQYGRVLSITYITCRAQTLQSALVELSEGYRSVSGKLPEAQTTFRSVLQGLLLVVVSSDEEAKEVSRVQSIYLFLIT